MREPRRQLSTPLTRAARREVARFARFPAFAALAIAALVIVVSLAGITRPATYAQETASWRVQAIAQDWVDLVVAAPWLVVAAAASLRGSRRASLLLGSGLAYTAYAFVVYAFNVHFNQMFLHYCAILGLSVYAMIGLALRLAAEDLGRGFANRAPRRTAAALLTIGAAATATMWLLDDVPAVIRDAPPASLAEAGGATNAIHVLDLSLALPALLVSAILLWQRRGSGYLLATIAMGFCVLMELDVAAIAVAMRRAGLVAHAGLAYALVAVAGFTAVLLVLLLRALSPQALRVIADPAHRLRGYRASRHAHALH